MWSFLLHSLFLSPFLVVTAWSFYFVFWSRREQKTMQHLVVNWLHRKLCGLTVFTFNHNFAFLRSFRKPPINLGFRVLSNDSIHFEIESHIPHIRQTNLRENRREGKKTVHKHNVIKRSNNNDDLKRATNTEKIKEFSMDSRTHHCFVSHKNHCSEDNKH